MKKLWPLLLATIVGVTILCSLGTWQVFRLAEKTKLIATLEARMEAEPTSLADVLDRRAKGEDIEYIKVFARGRINMAHAIAKISTYKGNPGWDIIAPFVSEDGIFVLVDAGSSPEAKVPSSDADTMTGIVRLHNKGRGFFDPDNEAGSDLWYWWDLPEMQAVTADQGPESLLETKKIAPFVLQRLPDAKEVGPPFSEKPNIELSNNHLGYAITWFGLAAALLAVAGFFARSIMLDRSK